MGEILAHEVLEHAIFYQCEVQTLLHVRYTQDNKFFKPS